MSSDLAVFDDSFFSDSFPFNFNIDSPIDFLQEIHNYNNPIHQIETNSSDQISPAILSSVSPPNSQLQILEDSSNVHAASSSIGVKTEGFQFPVINPFFDLQRDCISHIYGDTESTVKMMQRSYSSNSFDENPSFIYQPQFGTPAEPPNFNSSVFSSPQNSPFIGQLRKANSTGELHMKRTESSFTEETISKVAPYTAQERKQRIHRYREKRNHRNFSKTIKYACRKTLADNRARIRGRFARTDETTNAAEDGHFIWMKGFCEENERGTGTVGRRATLLNNNYYGAGQLQYCGY